MRTAIIGCGAIAPLHIEGLLKQEVEIVALCDTKEEKAAALISRYKLKDCKIYTDYYQLLAAVGVESIHICTPHYLHAEMSIAALKRGINVFCEKPMCITEAEIKKIEEAKANSAAIFGVCFQNRYISAVEEAKRLLKGRKINSIASTLLWNRDRDYYEQSGWRGQRCKEGGGVLINQAIHTLDIMLMLAGMPEYIQAHVVNRHLQGIIDVEDTAELYYKAGDAVCQLFATTASGVNYPVSIRIDAEGLQLNIVGEKLFVDGELAECNTRPLSGKSYWGQGHAIIIEEFYRSVREGGVFGVGAEEGAKSLKVLLAAYRANGGQVKV